MRCLPVLLLPVLFVSCISQVQVAFTADSTTDRADIGVLRQQDYFFMGRKPDMYLEYRGPVNYVAVGKGLRGSAESFTFRHDACEQKHEVSYTYTDNSGAQQRFTTEFVPAQVEAVIFSRLHGILVRPVGGSALLRPLSEARMCTD